jgi:TonB-like protein
VVAPNSGENARSGAQRVAGGQRPALKRLRGKDPDAFYPVAARERRIDGIAVVDLLIGDDGRVIEATLVSEDPPGEGFGLAGLDVAKTWEFDNTLRKLVLMQVNVAFLP